jgi:thymidylate synthase (FAD)
MYGKDIVDFKKHHYNILDSGYLTLIDVMGTDKDIARSARVSYNNHNSQKTETDDKRLINYLMKNRHTSPFEMCELKFQVKLPLFVKNQWERHRTWKYMNINEISGRYSDFSQNAFYIPEKQNIKKQSKDNKQCSGEVIEDSDWILFAMEVISKLAFKTYNDFITEKNSLLSREMARIILPLSTYTEFIFKVDLHNLLHFITLRNHPHAQWEIQEYARALSEVVKDLFPWTWNAFDNYVLGAKTFSRDDLEALSSMTDISDIKKLLGMF